MAREQTNPREEHWSRHHAKASDKTKTIHIYEWKCRDCGTMNKTTVDPSDERSTRKCFRGVEARCGHCHGNIRRLTDSKGLTYDPNVT